MKTGVLKTTILSLVTISVYGLPDLKSLSEDKNLITKNTIFGDERLAGEIFEDVDAFSNVELSPMNEDAANYRLPRTTIPTHYNLLWTIDLSQEPLRHSGTVEIHLQATQASVNEIVIHSDALTLTRIQLTQGNNQIPTTYEVDAVNQLLRIRLTSGSLTYNVDPNNPVIYFLTIDFASELRDDMRGLYRNWFRNSPTDAVRFLASTHFQATAARWAFPCYDEPSFKATFSVTIRRQSTHRSWFCTRLSETRPSTTPGFVDDVYQTTPIMSTYLLAVIVAEYDSITVTNTEGALSYEVIARPAAISSGQGRYALDVGQALLREMSSHTAYDFYSIHPNLKMTQASVPDFSAGAMENWGLLIYREAYLMLDEADTNSVFKQRIASVLSHEIAHMWFGNLVTCDWWDNLWLNEGFARYYQYYLTYWVEDMGFDVRFITEQVHTSLLADSANNPHPLTASDLNTNPAVRTMFSTISYNKGASIIRMTEHLLGSDVHLQGLRNYLRGRAFQTSTPIQLFQYLQEVGLQAGVLNYGSDFSFIDYYMSWTSQPGHPVLDVQVNHQTGTMTITQRRFNINTGYSTAVNTYIVPITFTTASNPNFVDLKPTHIISQTVTTINRGSVGDEWVIFNKQQSGFYRVNYDEYTWDLISIALRGADRTLIHTYNRAQIVDDVFQFARSGIMTYTRALNILSFLENETDYAPWVAAITGFNWLRNRLASATTVTELNGLNALIIRWASRVMTSITYYPVTGESFLQSYLRLQLAPLMCNLGVQNCIDAALSQFQALVNNNIPVPVDSRNWVYCNALRHGSAADFNYLWNRFLNHNVYTEKILILENLGCTRDASSLQTFLNAIVNVNYVIRPQDYTNAFSSAVSGNEENTDIVLAFIQQNLNLVANAFSGSTETPFSYVIARLRSNERIDQFTTWATLNQQNLGSSYSTVMSYANSARASIVWAESVREDIRYFLETGAVAPSTSTSTTTTQTSTAPTTTSTTTTTTITTPTTTTTTTTTTTEPPATAEEPTTAAVTGTTPGAATTSFISRWMLFITIILLPFV